MAEGERIGGTAVVIGASMAGLLAARVLAERYGEVIIIERDTLPHGADHRRSVPQSRHAHALLGGGREALETLFPGLTDALVARGAVRGGRRIFSGGGYHHPVNRGPEGLFVSRPLLEDEVRTRVRALPNVRIIEGCDVHGLTTSAGGTRVNGLRLARRGVGAAKETVAADLIVDAGGRGSRTPAWLDSLGYPQPEEELVDVKMGYATREYRREPAHLDGNLMLTVAPTRANRRACGMLAEEGDRWIITLAGYFGDYPPTDEAGFLEFARSLPTPEIAEVVRSATPLTDLLPFRFPANQWRHYERLARFPEGLLVIGDAIASFTPIYGQGMTVAAREALALRDCLARGTDQLAPRFFKRASAAVAIAWSITVGNDRKLSGSPDSQAGVKRLLNWYLGKLQVAARRDETVAYAFLRAANLLAAPPSLLRPDIALRVLWGNLRVPGRDRSGEGRRKPQPQLSRS